MKLINIFAALFLCTVCAQAHPLHLSITNITYENGKLKVSMKTFLDDWETAYFHYHSTVIDFSDPSQREIPWFRNYLEKVFRVSLDKDGQPLVMKMDTITIEEGSMNIELGIGVPGQPKSLYLYNALLTDIYPDQTNLVIFGTNKRETGIKFDVMKHDEIVLLE
jgi:hypothetical protein